MLTFMTILLYILYFLWLLVIPLTFIVLLIFRLATYNVKKAMLGCFLSHVAVFVIYLLLMYQFPYHTGDIKKADFNSFTQQIQVYQESEINEYAQPEIVKGEKLSNVFYISYVQEHEERYAGAGMEIIVIKHFDEKEAKLGVEQKDLDLRTMSRFLNGKYSSKNNENSAELRATKVSSEQNFLLPPDFKYANYGKEIVLRHKNYVIEIDAGTSGTDFKTKDALFTLLEQSDNLEYWLTHDMGYRMTMDGEFYEPYNPQPVKPQLEVIEEEK